MRLIIARNSPRRYRNQPSNPGFLDSLKIYSDSLGITFRWIPHALSEQLNSVWNNVAVLHTPGEQQMTLPPAKLAVPSKRSHCCRIHLLAHPIATRSAHCIDGWHWIPRGGSQPSSWPQESTIGTTIDSILTRRFRPVSPHAGPVTAELVQLSGVTSRIWQQEEHTCQKEQLPRYVTVHIW